MQAPTALVAQVDASIGGKTAIGHPRAKKAKDDRVPFVLAPEIGAFRLVFDVPRTVILDALAELG